MIMDVVKLLPCLHFDRQPVLDRLLEGASIDVGLFLCIAIMNSPFGNALSFNFLV